MAHSSMRSAVPIFSSSVVLPKESSTKSSEALDFLGNGKPARGSWLAPRLPDSARETVFSRASSVKTLENAKPGRLSDIVLMPAPTLFLSLKESTLPSFASTLTPVVELRNISKQDALPLSRFASITTALSKSFSILEFFQHRVLVTIRELDALYAISPDFLRQYGLVHRFEFEFFEEGRLVGKRENPFYSEPSGFVKAGVHEARPYAAAARVLSYREGPYLGQILPAYMESGDAHDRSARFENVKIPKIRIYLVKRPVEHLALPGVELHHVVYVFCVFKKSLPYQYFLPFIAFILLSGLRNLPRT